jgi:hypothetical protein
MANSLAHDKMCTLWEETAETTSMKMALSKDLNTYSMGSDANMDRASSESDNSNDSGSDREYIPQDYRFETQDGIVSQDSDYQDIVDRMIPVNRNKSKRILAQIDAKGLRDPQRRSQVAKGFARDIANAVDTTCYKTMLDRSTMIIKNTSDFSFETAIDAEVKMLNHGLGAFDRKLFLANTDYAKVAKDLGASQYHGGSIPVDALTRAKIPNLATFDTMRSDYLIRKAAPAATGMTVNGAQSHTVATFDSNGFYLDNREMVLAITGGTAAKLPVGRKFTIAGVEFLHPETRETTGDLLEFTVLSSGTGTATISPAIVTTGPYRNASAAAAAGAAITVINTVETAPSLFYAPESTVLVPGRLPVPQDGAGVNAVEATTEQGLPMRLTYEYDFHNEVFNMKALVFFDCQVVLPNLLGSIYSNQT